MINQVIIVGKLIEKPILKDKICNITIAVNRPYKNEECIYETDFIPVLIKGCVAQSVAEYCEKGDIISIKGMLQSNINNIILVGEKVTILSSRKNEGE